MHAMIRLSVTIALIMAVFGVAGEAQQTDQSSKIRSEGQHSAGGAVLGTKPDKVLKIVKVRGVISKIDLLNRTVTFSSKGQEDPLELAFSQPAGREQIKTVKKAAKSLGKRKLSLEELTVGSKVQIEYYTTLGQMLEMLVEEAKS